MDEDGPYGPCPPHIRRFLDVFYRVRARGLPADEVLFQFLYPDRVLPQGPFDVIAMIEAGHAESFESFDGPQRAHEVPRVTLANLPYHVVSLDNTKDIAGDRLCCAICLQNVQQGETLRSLPSCRHSFHINCVDKWLAEHPTCPLCRRAI